MPCFCGKPLSDRDTIYHRYCERHYTMRQIALINGLNYTIMGDCPKCQNEKLHTGVCNFFGCQNGYVSSIDYPDSMHLPEQIFTCPRCLGTGRAIDCSRCGYLSPDTQPVPLETTTKWEQIALFPQTILYD